MAQLEILEYPDPRLRQRAEPVEAVDESIRTLARDMLETMYAAPGIGLAAIQVNVPKRVIVVDVSEDGSEPLVLVNPEVFEEDGKEVMQENTTIGDNQHVIKHIDKHIGLTCRFTTSNQSNSFAKSIRSSIQREETHITSGQPWRVSGLDEIIRSDQSHIGCTK